MSAEKCVWRRCKDVGNLGWVTFVFGNNNDGVSRSSQAIFVINSVRVNTKRGGGLEGIEFSN